ncbi:MAG: bifunctional homocysteine S-methyltransferase/methylenetetrahydrofolate reductase [Nitrospirae bacterium CG2_30_70_394]|nr:bifunctional homocysteine S-methyltransferase/methylenetetrahydrofolate reductase [Deltaproteobacteria bacterium]OIP62176.1 MAG: bifunctional homocysteine S-methyltransferase/methylenetetrahydrofolate reductase [Nitrospirae bacterium CG2_30_70_394]
MSSPFLAAVAARVILADGAMGTQLYEHGLFLNQCYDAANLTHPQLVQEIHEQYAEAGAEILETNTFGASRQKLTPYGFGDQVEAINRAGAAIARKVAGKTLFVAGAVGPLPLRLAPLGKVSAASACAAFTEQMRGLVAGGIDLFCLESFGLITEILAALEAAREVAPGLPVIAQMTVDENGYTSHGTPAEEFARALDQAGAEVIGVNCSVGPAPMLETIERIAAVTGRPLSAQPNAGLPRNVDDRLIYMSSPEYFAEYARNFVRAGVKIVGGCCGTGPAHIRAMRSAIRSLVPGRTTIHIEPREQLAGAATPPPLAARSALGAKLAAGRFVTSVEITPPRGADASGVLESCRTLKGAGIDIVNIPDGPRASARMGAQHLAILIERAVGIESCLHYTCRDRNLLAMQSDLLGLAALGIHNILIITGDPPKMGDYPDATAVFDIDSVGLTHLAAATNHGLDLGGNRIGPPTSFVIGVGANPGATNLDRELDHFRAKVEQGAEFAITQPVFDPQILLRFLDKIEPFRIPILAGIWPLVSLRNAEFMAHEVPGVIVPDVLVERMRVASARSKEAARDAGLAIAREALAAVKDRIDGVQVSAPFGRVELALPVIEAAADRL